MSSQILLTGADSINPTNIQYLINLRWALPGGLLPELDRLSEDSPETRDCPRIANYRVVFEPIFDWNRTHKDE